MPWLIAGILVVVIAAVSGVARAETFKNAPREADPETWRGKGDPPPALQPRPKFRVGETVIETSTGKPQRRIISEIAGVKSKSGNWIWNYYFTDGSGAGEGSLQKA
jgi:hypothetical protein